jgi:hypothetical protein
MEEGWGKERREERGNGNVYVLEFWKKGKGKISLDGFLGKR